MRKRGTGCNRSNRTDSTTDGDRRKRLEISADGRDDVTDREKKEDPVPRRRGSTGIAFFSADDDVDHYFPPHPSFCRPCPKIRSKSRRRRPKQTRRRGVYIRRRGRRRRRSRRIMCFPRPHIHTYCRTDPRQRHQKETSSTRQKFARTYRRSTDRRKAENISCLRNYNIIYYVPAAHPYTRVHISTYTYTRVRTTRQRVLRAKQLSNGIAGPPIRIFYFTVFGENRNTTVSYESI